MQKNKFTLIELLVVIAILGILAAMIFPALGTARNIKQARIEIDNAPAKIQNKLSLKLKDLRSQGFSSEELTLFKVYVSEMTEEYNKPVHTVVTNTTYPTNINVTQPKIAPKNEKIVSRETVLSVKSLNTMKGMDNLTVEVMAQIKTDIKDTVPVFGTYILLRKGKDTVPPIKDNHTYMCEDDTNFYYKRD